MNTNIHFHNYTTLSTQDLEQILSWRNDESVKKWMRNTNEITWDEHIRFVNSLKENKKAFHYLVNRKNQNCAVVNFTFEQIDSKEAEWGIYLSPQILGSGIGLEICFHTLHFFFNNFDANEIFGFVKAENTENIHLQELLGLQIVDEKLDSGIKYIKMSIQKNKYQQMPKDYLTLKKQLFKI